MESQRLWLPLQVLNQGRFQQTPTNSDCTFVCSRLYLQLREITWAAMKTAWLCSFYKSIWPNSVAPHEPTKYGEILINDPCAPSSFAWLLPPFPLISLGSSDPVTFHSWKLRVQVQHGGCFQKCKCIVDPKNVPVLGCSIHGCAMQLASIKADWALLCPCAILILSF